MICPKCGNDAGNSAFCTKCGNPMNAEPQASAAPQAPAAPQSPAHGAQAFASNAAAQAGATMNNVQNALEQKTGKKLPKWTVPAIAAGAVVIIVLLICIIAGSGNNYKKPVKARQQILNSVRKNDGDITYSDYYTDYEVKCLNGLCSSDFKKIMKIMCKSDYTDLDDDMEFPYDFEGSVKVKIDDKEEIDEDDDLDDYHDSIKSCGKEILEYVKEIEDAAEDDDDFYADVADELGISKSEVKSLVKYLKSIGEALKDNKVKAGYELELEIEGVEDYEESNMVVLKVNGKWVDLEVLEEVVGVCEEVASGILYAV